MIQRICGYVTFTRLAEGAKPAVKTPAKKAARTPSKKATAQAKTPKPKNEERVDAVRDRDLKRKYVGKKISVDYAGLANNSIFFCFLFVKK